jgi:hypothetical protein
MKEAQEKTYTPTFRCVGNMAIVLSSVEKQPEVKPVPVPFSEKQYLHHGVFLTSAELRDWDDK